MYAVLGGGGHVAAVAALCCLQAGVLLLEKVRSRKREATMLLDIDMTCFRCQARDWKLSHRRTCGRAQLVQNADALMLFKVWAATHATAGWLDTVDGDEVRLLCETFLSLPHLVDRSSGQQRMAAASVARLALACYYDSEEAVRLHIDGACVSLELCRAGLTVCFTTMKRRAST